MNSLPSAEVVSEVFQAHVDLLKPRGKFYSVEYVGTSTLKEWLTFWGREVAIKVVAAKKAFYRDHHSAPVIVWRNFPPARVHRMQLAN